MQYTLVYTPTTLHSRLQQPVAIYYTWNTETSHMTHDRKTWHMICKHDILKWHIHTGQMAWKHNTSTWHFHTWHMTKIRQVAHSNDTWLTHDTLKRHIHTQHMTHGTNSLIYSPKWHTHDTHSLHNSPKWHMTSTVTTHDTHMTPNHPTQWHMTHTWLPFTHQNGTWKAH